MVIVQIQADDREGQSGMLSLLQSHPQVNLNIKRMGCGDYLLDNWLLVERKQIKDLLISIIDGRLFQQAQGLCQSKYKPLIVIEGRASDIQDCHMNRRAVLGALASVSLIFGIAVLRTINQQETVDLLLYAAQQRRQIQKQELVRCDYRPKSIYRRQLFLLQGLPGVGIKLAKRLLLHFGSVQCVMHSTQEQLQQVDGVGATKANKIRELLECSVN